MEKESCKNQNQKGGEREGANLVSVEIVASQSDHSIARRLDDHQVVKWKWIWSK
jgi:hypothetical protein